MINLNYGDRFIASWIINQGQNWKRADVICIDELIKKGKAADANQFDINVMETGEADYNISPLALSWLKQQINLQFEGAGFPGLVGVSAAKLEEKLTEYLATKETPDE
jgi:hypothetical protein